MGQENIVKIFFIPDLLSNVSYRETQYNSWFTAKSTQDLKIHKKALKMKVCYINREEDFFYDFFNIYFK